MAAKNNLEVNLTPQNQEWVKLIPNPTQNLDIIFNNLIDASIREGLLLEVISQSLAVSDLSKFKNAYGRIQAKRAAHMAELEIAPPQIERKKVIHTESVEAEEELVEVEEIKPAQLPKKKEKKLSHGFEESEF